MDMTTMMNSCPWEAIVDNLPANDGAFVQRACQLDGVDYSPELDRLIIRVTVGVGLLGLMSDKLALLKESGEELFGQIPTFVLALGRVS